MPSAPPCAHTSRVLGFGCTTVPSPRNAKLGLPLVGPLDVSVGAEPVTKVITSPCSGHGLAVEYQSTIDWRCHRMRGTHRSDGDVVSKRQATAASPAIGVRGLACRVASHAKVARPAGAGADDVDGCDVQVARPRGERILGRNLQPGDGGGDQRRRGSASSAYLPIHVKCTPGRWSCSWCCKAPGRTWCFLSNRRQASSEQRTHRRRGTHHFRERRARRGLKRR